MGILDRTKNERPDEGGKAIKFVQPGDAVVAQFQGRKVGVKTKNSKDENDLASVTNVYVVDSNIRDINPGTYGSIWEGSHVREIMERENLVHGDGFVLRFAETKGRFKQFFYKKLTTDELEQEAREKGVELAEVPF